MTTTSCRPAPDPVVGARATSVLGAAPATTADPSVTTGPASTSGPGPASDRIEALDLVRLLAIVGMMTAHLLALLALMPDAGGIQGQLARAAHVLTEGPSSTLFAVIGGCSLVLATRRRLESGDRHGAVASVLVRGACCVPGRAGTPGEPPLSPRRAAPLTLYVIHVALTSVARIAAILLSGGDLTSMPWYVAGLGVLAMHLVLAVGLGALLAARGTSGPLEALLARIGRRLVRS